MHLGPLNVSLLGNRASLWVSLVKMRSLVERRVGLKCDD